ncbi:contactin [Microplitis mediator]|uniref:contactin n=1 Tax=Microplitis mediator TaxID=375433 RepID=UPI0025526138|nr:contactin [Microplitis mediator]
MEYHGFLSATCLFISIAVITGQNIYSDDSIYQCPKHWLKHQDSCYRFIKSPLKKREEAKRTCEAYQSDLVSINTIEEHGFLIKELQWRDPQHRTWYIGGKLSGGYWSNEADGSSLSMVETAILPEPNDGIIREYLAYDYSPGLQKWGLKKVTPNEDHLFICEAHTSTLSNLVEDERDYKYGIEIDNPLRIPRGPYFTTQPQDQVFDAAEQYRLINEITLKCHAEGWPTPTYEWYKEEYRNGRTFATQIDPLTNSRYTVTGGNLVVHKPEQREDDGAYHCKASNEYGTIISESVKIQFGYILEFNLKRSEERGDQNWGKTIYCDPPQHFPDVNYYWSRDFFPNWVEEDKRVLVSNDGALYFSALEPIDAGNYSCSVQSTASRNGQKGPFFPLRVDHHSSFQQLKFANNFPKVFPDAPVAGDNVTFECMAFGYPVPSYNWTRVGAPLPHDSVLAKFNRILEIHNIKVEDQGTYQCRASNERADILGEVTLSIQAKPNFTIPLEDKHADKDSDLTWSCEAFGVPDVTYSWYKNGELLNIYELELEDRDRFTIHDNVLKIQRLDPERDPGMYQCAAKNELKTKYSSAQLRVLSMKPSFKKHPMEPETYAAEGGNVTIVCNPEAAPRPKFVWKKDGNIIGSGGKRHILPNGNLIINRVSRDDEGFYVCMASNQYGNDESRGRLIVLRGPYLTEQLPVRIITAVMYNHTLRCQADVDPKLDVAYVWKHNGLEIREKDILNNPRYQIYDGTFHLINITLSDAGEYECELKSAVGSVSSKATMIVEGPPGPPGGVQVNIVKTSASLHWTDGAQNGRPILMYRVSGNTSWSGDWFMIVENITAIEIDRYTERKQAELENVLNPFTTYEFRVSAANEFGYGPYSLPSPKYSTPPAKPQRAPARVGGGGGKVGELTITWEPLPPAYQNGRNVHYKVFWRRKGKEHEFQSLLLKDRGNIGKYVASISPDYYYMQYEVKVQVFNEAGEGPTSDIATVYSAEDLPIIQPQGIKILRYNSTSLNVTWTPVPPIRESLKGNLTGYRIKYWPDGNDEDDAIYYLSRSQRPWALIVGLQPDTSYFAKVMAYNSAGAGPESERFLERTFRKAPQNPPTSVFPFEVNPSTVKVIWRYVQPDWGEEPLDGYKVRVWEFDQDMSTANDTIVRAGQKLEAYVRNLSPGKTYNLRILAFSKGGDGRMSSPPLTFQMGDPAQFRNSASNKIFDAGICITILLIFKHFM